MKIRKSIIGLSLIKFLWSIKQIFKIYNINQFNQMSINQYKVQKQIGKGSFAIVYKAQKISTKQKVAIKIIKNTLTVQENLIAQKQIDVLKEIDHKNIIKLNQKFLKDGSWYLVFEYCVYGDLQKFWNTKKPFSEKLTQCITYQIINALQFLEQKNIAHRDIKLANILIDENYCIKLADLGFAKIASHQQKLFVTYAGTPLMMAPEVLDKQKYTIKCDVWSLGIIVYMMLFQKNPFYPKQGGLQQLIQLVKNSPVQFPKSPKISESAKNFIQKCLQKDPTKRMDTQQMLNHEWFLNINKKNQQLKRLLCQQLFDEKFKVQERQQSEDQSESMIISQLTDNLKSNFIMLSNLIDQKMGNLKSFSKGIEKVQSMLQPEQINILSEILMNRINEWQTSYLQITFNQQNLKFSYKFEDYFKNGKIWLDNFKKNIHNNKYNNNNLQKQLIKIILKLYNNNNIQQQQPDYMISDFIVNALNVLKIHYSFFKIQFNIKSDIEDETLKLIKKKLGEFKQNKILKLYNQSKNYQKNNARLIDMFQNQIHFDEETKEKSNIVTLQKWFKLFHFI